MGYNKIKPEDIIPKANKFMSEIRNTRKSKQIAVSQFATECNIKLIRYSDLEMGVDNPTPFEEASISTAISKYQK